MENHPNPLTLEQEPSPLSSRFSFRIGETKDSSNEKENRLGTFFSRNITFISLAGSILALIVGITVFLNALFNSSSSPPRVETQREPSFNQEEYWMHLRQVLLPDRVLIPETPQSRAMEWMVADDPLAPLEKAWKIQQRYALATLYFSWEGDSWILPQGGWLREGPAASEEECDWDDVVCDASGRVEGLLFERETSPVDAIGTLPSEIALLERLRWLDATNQNLIGTMPSEIFTLTSLRGVLLAKNQLTRIPESTGPLTSLDLSSNQMKGSASSSLLRNPFLADLLVNDNPELQGNLTELILAAGLNLRTFNAADTQMLGSLPDTMAKLSNLVVLNLAHTSTTGTLPTEIGLLHGLHELDMTGTNLEGEIPTEIGW